MCWVGGGVVLDTRYLASRVVVECGALVAQGNPEQASWIDGYRGTSAARTR